MKGRIEPTTHQEGMLRTLSAKSAGGKGKSSRKKQGLGFFLSTCFALSTGAAFEPPAPAWPTVDGAFSSPQEYARAIKVRDDRNVGWYYNQYATNWHSTNTLTFFKFHAFDDPGYGQLDLYDMNSFEFVWSNVVVMTWVFLQGDEFPANDLWWLNPAGLGNYSSFDDDGGFLVRLDNDPTTDRRWRVGDPQPGQPGWDFTNFYGVFAYGDLNNSAFINGYSMDPAPRELYEWSITLNYLPSKPGGPPAPGGVILPPPAGGGGGGPPLPGICDPIWTNVVVTNTVKDWKPKMGGWGTIGGIGHVVSNYWVFMGWDTSKHPFIPLIPINPGPLNGDTVVTMPGNILSQYEPGGYVVLDDSPTLPGRALFDVEMVQLDIVGGTLSGLMLRESPGLRSPGKTLTLLEPDGQYRISSFFDVFTELSLDGGMTWGGATNGALRMNLAGGSPPNVFPMALLPPNGQYISREEAKALYEQGVVVSNVTQSEFSASIAPPLPGQNVILTFSSQVEMDLSTDGGNTFAHVSAPAMATLAISNCTVEVGGGEIPFSVGQDFAPSLIMCNATNTYLLDGPGTIDGTAPLFKQNSGELILASPNTYSGGTVLSGGILTIAHALALGSGPLTLSHGAFQSTGMAPLSIPNRLVLLGDPTLGGPDTPGLVFTAATADIGLEEQIVHVASPVVIHSAVTNEGGLIKAGAAPLTLDGINTYSGPTTVSNGVLAITGMGSIGNSSLIRVESVLDLLGRTDETFWLAEGQSLAGNGTVRALSVVAQPGSTISPGTSIGTLTVSGNLTFMPGSTNFMEVDRSAGANDVIRSVDPGGTVTYGGTLSVSNVSAAPIVLGDSFALFQAPAYSGAFDGLQPGTPGPGLAWDTTTLKMDGTLRVKIGVATNPTNIVHVLLPGNVLRLSWPSDHLGWSLETQTNAPNTGLGPNWFRIPDSDTKNEMLFPVAPENGSVFYRLVYP